MPTADRSFFLLSFCGYLLNPPITWSHHHNDYSPSGSMFSSTYVAYVVGCCFIWFSMLWMKNSPIGRFAFDIEYKYTRTIDLWDLLKLFSQQYLLCHVYIELKGPWNGLRLWTWEPWPWRPSQYRYFDRKRNSIKICNALFLHMLNWSY